ncbi:MAG: tetratricopeptide repeat protein [Polyangiales bacterium]
MLAALGSGGCVTRQEGDRLHTEARQRTVRIAELEKKLRALRARHDALAALVERSTQTVTRKSADLAVEIHDMEARLGGLDGKLAELDQMLMQAKQDLESRVEAMARKSGAESALGAQDIPADAEAHFQQAFQRYKAGDLAEARALFRAYVERYPKDARADNAQYWVGATLLKEDKPANALGAYRQVLSSYPKEDAVDETLLDMAEAFYRLHACSDARAALKTLLQVHKNSPLRSRAQGKLRHLNKTPRSYCTN